jgi:hypothetical protein
LAVKSKFPLRRLRRGDTGIDVIPVKTARRIRVSGHFFVSEYEVAGGAHDCPRMIAVAASSCV